MYLDPRGLSLDTCEEAQQTLLAVASNLAAFSKGHCLLSCQCGPCRAARLARQAADALQQEADQERRSRGPSKAERSES